MAIPRKNSDGKPKWISFKMIACAVFFALVYVSQRRPDFATLIDRDRLLDSSYSTAKRVDNGDGGDTVAFNTRGLGEGGSSYQSQHRVNIPISSAASHTVGVSKDVSSSGFDGNPYFMNGRTVRVVKPSLTDLNDILFLERYRSNDAEYDEKATLQMMEMSKVAPIPDHQNNWVLPKKLQHPTRNHDNIIFDVEPSGRQLLLVLLGRFSETIQWIDLLTGKRSYANVTGEDPAGNVLSSLNHVYSVIVDSLTAPSHKEVWLPCGFHGDTVNKEVSTEYVRIVDLKTMQVTSGPKLPFAGGACVAAPIYLKGPDHPAHVCMFGGTDGGHDEGNFVPYTSCYDRVEEKWHFPFGRLPYGFDHGNFVHLPSGVCAPDDPERLLIFNFRTVAYGTAHPEILAYDLPIEPWTTETLNSLDAETPGSWYIYSNISYSSRHDEVNAPRDASGLAIANNWRNILNFGGVHYYNHTWIQKENRTIMKKKHRKYATVRSLDVCGKQWTKVGDMGLRDFAIQTGVSARMNLAISCGGLSYASKHQNIPWCMANRIPGMQLQSNRGSTVTEEQISGML